MVSLRFPTAAIPRLPPTQAPNGFAIAATVAAAAAAAAAASDDKAAPSVAAPAAGCRNNVEGAGEEGNPPQGLFGLRTFFSKKVY